MDDEELAEAVCTLFYSCAYILTMPSARQACWSTKVRLRAMLHPRWPSFARLKNVTDLASETPVT